LKKQLSKMNNTKLILITILSLIQVGYSFIPANLHRSSTILERDIDAPNLFGKISASTVTAPPREKVWTRRKKRYGEKEKGFEKDDIVRRGGNVDYSNPLEYLFDINEARGSEEDPFHILLLGKTFNNPKISVAYVATSLMYVLSMPEDDALEHAKFCKVQGVSTLGTWTRKECLDLGRQLQQRDLECRVVPYCEGAGGGGWQADKDASTPEDLKSANAE